jgi:hypothetical protein
MKKNWLFTGMLAGLLVFALVLTGCEVLTDETPEEEGESKKSATTLTLNTWADGSLAVGGEQWFQFTATATNQYIHVDFGTLTNLNVQLHDSAGNSSGDSVYLTSSYGYSYVSLSVTNGSVYYIKVWPSSSSGSGSYKIGFTTSVTTPGEIAAMASATTLTLDTWKDGSVATDGADWYKFTATATNQYIHVDFGILTSLNIRLHDSAGNRSGDSVYLTSSYGYSYISLSVTSGSVYYIKVWPSSGSGSYKIGFTTSVTTPGEMAAMASATTLTLDTWADSSVAAAGQDWYKFTATAANQYIHVDFGTLTNLNVHLHDSAGNRIGDGVRLSSTKYVSLSVTSGSVYLIKVWPASGSGSYKIGFNESDTPPN